jgi:hypothetical protein
LGDPNIILDFNFSSQISSSPGRVPAGLSLIRLATNSPRYGWGTAANPGLLSGALGANVPCWDYDWGTIHLEPAMSSVLLRSTALDNAGSWTVFNGGALLTGKADARGGTAAFGMTSDVANAQTLNQSVANAAAKFLMWAIVKDDAGVGSSTVSGIQTGFLGGTQNSLPRCQLNTTVPYVRRNPANFSQTFEGPFCYRKGTSGFAVMGQFVNSVSTLAAYRFDARIGSGKTIIVQDPGICIVTGSGTYLPPNPIDTAGASASNNADALTLTAASLAALAALGDTYTWIIDWMGPDNAQLLQTGGGDYMVAPTTGTATQRPRTGPQLRRTIMSCKPGTMKIYDSIAPGMPTTGVPPTLGADLKIGLDRPIDFKRIRLSRIGLA